MLLRFVDQHNIALVTASDKRSYDVEDAALFDLTLDADDLAALRAAARATLVLRLLRKTLPHLHGCGSGRGLPARDCGGCMRRGQPLGARRPRRVRRRRRRSRREGVRDGVSAVGYDSLTVVKTVVHLAFHTSRSVPTRSVVAITAAAASLVLPRAAAPA